MVALCKEEKVQILHHVQGLRCVRSSASIQMSVLCFPPLWECIFPMALDIFFRLGFTKSRYVRPWQILLVPGELWKKKRQNIEFFMKQNIFNLKECDSSAASSLPPYGTKMSFFQMPSQEIIVGCLMSITRVLNFTYDYYNRKSLNQYSRWF